MEFIVLLLKTVLLRPYVFLFLGISLYAASRLIGWPRTGWMFGLTWLTAFTCEITSTRVGIPFGMYYYTGSTVGQELYLSNVPVMDTLSFTFLLFASYCLALWFVLPSEPAAPSRWPRIGLRFDLAARTSWPVLGLTTLFFVFIDIVIDPVALQGDRWFLGQIYGYPEPGTYFGVPIANFIGWGVVGCLAVSGYAFVDHRLSPPPQTDPVSVCRAVLLGCGLYYAVLMFNLGVTFWIGEYLLGMTGVLIYLPITALFAVRFLSTDPSAARASVAARHSSHQIESP
jgi:putative membrane protein